MLATAELCPFSIRSVGSIHATQEPRSICLMTCTLSVSALSDRFMPLDSASGPGWSDYLSVSALSDRFMPPHAPTAQTLVHALDSGLSVSALSDRFMPPAYCASGQAVTTEASAFQYPLCRIDSCHPQPPLHLFCRCRPFSIRSVGSIHATFAGCVVEHLSACFSIRSVGSIHATPAAKRHRGYALDAAFSIRSVGSIHATTDRSRATTSHRSFSIRSVGSIHATPAGKRSQSGMLIVGTFSIRSVGSIHATPVRLAPASCAPAVFQYPLCRIDSVTEAARWRHGRSSTFSIRSVGSMVMSRPFGRPSFVPDVGQTLSVSALSDRFMPQQMTVASTSIYFAFSIRSVGSIHATMPMAVADSKRSGSFSIRSVGSIHATAIPHAHALGPAQAFSIRSVGSIHATDVIDRLVHFEDH